MAKLLSGAFARIGTAFEEGISEFQLGHFEGAVRRLEEAAYASPNEARVLMWLASAYLQNRQVDAAVSVYRRLLRFPDPRVRRFADSGLKSCAQAGFTDSGTFGNETYTPQGPGFLPPLDRDAAIAVPEPPDHSLRMASLSLWDIAFTALRIASEEWRNFALMSLSGYLWLLGSVLASAVILWAATIFGGRPEAIGELATALSTAKPQVIASLLTRPTLFNCALGFSSCLLALGAGAWLLPLLSVQRWTYYVYVGQAYPFWQNRQTVLGRLGSISQSLFWGAALTVLPLTALRLAPPLRSVEALLLGATGTCFCLWLLARSLAVLPAIAVHDIGGIRGLLRSWQLTRGHLRLMVALVLVLLVAWPLICWTGSGLICSLIVGNSALSLLTRFTVQILITLGLYSLAFPLLGAFLGTAFYDLSACEPER